MQHVTATPALVPSASAHPGVALRCEGNRRRAPALIVVMRTPTLRNGVIVATPGFETEDVRHQTLPLFAMGSDIASIEGMGYQVGDFMGDGLTEEVFVILTVHPLIETQQVASQISDTGPLAAQVQRHAGARKGAAQTLFCDQVRLFDCFGKVFHAVSIKPKRLTAVDTLG